MLADFIKISDEQFSLMGGLITKFYGIKLPLEKKIMFQSRLQKRLRELGLTSFDDYSKRLFDIETGKDEIEIMVDYISTNKTDFFREKDHFEILTELIPKYVNEAKLKEPALLKIWSAGCSSGQEAFSIAITLEECFNQNHSSLNYLIIGTDISQKVVSEASRGIYPMGQIDDLSIEMKKKYFLKGKSTDNPKVKVMQSLRNKVRFVKHNLMDQSYEILGKFDFIFLRNTLIYFESKVQKQVLNKVLDHLKSDGYLFIGHSESLINMDLPIQSISPSVYKKT